MDVNSNMQGVLQIDQLISSISKLENKNSAQQQEGLESLFSESYFNDSIQKEKIDAEVARLNKEIEGYQDEIDDLLEKREELEDKIGDLSEEMAKKANQIVQETNDYQAKYEDKVALAFSNALSNYLDNMYSAGNDDNRKDMTLNEYITIELQNMKLPSNSGISKLIAELGSDESELSGYSDDIEGFIEDVGNINDRYSFAKSTMTLLQATSANMTDASKGYASASNERSVPMFTPAKAEVADGYLAQYNSRLAGTEGSTPAAPVADKASVMDKYSQGEFKAAQTGGVDPYSTDNAQLNAFKKALDAGMMEDMSAAGFSQKDVLDTVKELYPSIGISHGDNGAAVIPWGHWSADERHMDHRVTEGGQIYAAFTEQFQSFGTVIPKSEEQVTEMSDAVKNDNIINEMKDSDFTWKETAYTLTRLWPNAGFQYNLGDMSITVPNEDDLSAGGYDKLAEDILSAYPDVTVNRGDATEDAGDVDNVQRIDPVGFSVGDDSYEFVIDRNQDGVFNDFSEMAGANGKCGITDMLAFDTNDDNKLTDDELKNVLLLNVDHMDHDSDELNYSFLTAEQMGIKEIDLSDTEDVNQERPDGSLEDFVGINNDLVTKTFDITMKNGTDIEGYQKYVASDYKSAVYDGITGENIFSQLSSKEIDSAIDAGYGDNDPYAEKLDGLVEDAEILKEMLAGENLKGALGAMFDSVVNNLRGLITSERAEMLDEYGHHDYNQQDLEKGIPVDELEEADPSMEEETARAIIEKYIDKDDNDSLDTAPNELITSLDFDVKLNEKFEQMENLGNMSSDDIHEWKNQDQEVQDAIKDGTWKKLVEEERRN